MTAGTGDAPITCKMAADGNHSAQIAQVREALELAEDVLSRSPFSTGIWPNGMHPNTGITKIRAALSALASGGEYPDECHPSHKTRVSDDWHAMPSRIGRLEAGLREIKDQYLSPDQSSAIARAALSQEQDK